ncbi:MAG: hypothetical protein NUV47_01095 [Patescibacteria group bacterium]|nr:hypothetical protein [Patescibacteria group bacterium]
MNHTDIKKLIEGTLIDTIATFPHPLIKGVKFYYIRNYGCTWKVIRKHSPIDIYPMKNSRQVKCFATLKNAKRNFIKNFFTVMPGWS